MHTYTHDRQYNTPLRKRLALLTMSQNVFLGGAKNKPVKILVNKKDAILSYPSFTFKNNYLIGSAT